MLAALLADPALMDRLGAAAAERAGRVYSWEVVTDAYERLAVELAEHLPVSGLEGAATGTAEGATGSAG